MKFLHRKVATERPRVKVLGVSQKNSKNGLQDDAAGAKRENGKSLIGHSLREH
jgi:hypothetical protein